MRPLARALPFAVLACLPAFAFAHVGADAGAHHGFQSGFAHPFTGLDHLAAMLAVGVWSALAAPRPQLRDYAAAPLAFASLLLIGALLAAGGLTLPAVEPMIAVSLLLLGLLVATRHTLPAPAAIALVGGFALFHGAAHGQELAGAGALAGMLLATVLLHAIGLAIGHAVRERSRWWPAVAGLATSLLGVALLIG